MMRLQHLELNGFKSFSKKTALEFNHPITSIVGPNGSGKSNVVEAFRFVLGEQSMKSMRGKGGADLIFKGSKSLPKGTRASATIYFNNQDKIFKLTGSDGENVELNYDVITISREVYPDGLNKYSLNGSEVRLKDINNLLASVNIGSSHHHIISQGEADRILNASSRDRREMIEDALGLKIYQYKIKDSERKLERTRENMKEVSMLRRENAPHINFLKKQVEKFEKAKEMRGELAFLYKDYLAKENVYLESERTALKSEKDIILKELGEINEVISRVESVGEHKENQKLAELRDAENKLLNIHRLKGELERKMGRIEGMIEAQEYRTEKVAETVVFSQQEVESIVSEVNTSIDEALAKEDVGEIKNILSSIKNILNKLNSKNERDDSFEKDKQNKIEELKNTQRGVEAEIQKIEVEARNISEVVRTLKEEISKDVEVSREEEREKFTLRVKHQELSSKLSIISVKEENLARGLEAFENEVKEGAVLIGREVFAYRDLNDAEKESLANGVIDKTEQEEAKRKIERIKIKLEDTGAGDAREITKEYEEALERDQFLAKETEDLAKSIESLNILIADLKEKIDIEFKEGIRKINTEFHQFFSLMFGGGTGALSVVVSSKPTRGRPVEDEESSFAEASEDKEEIEFEQGIEINVSLPHKKVKELHSLSGGERSLTSIALLFAMSQVNPPPFLILDETDAALDEANSRKYGDMLEKLSKHSQLIVVTHNRETMSRAGVLYGVTIGADGASKILSVKFEEAQAIAK